MGLSLLEGFAKSLAMTVLSEIGDNTFFAAAILAMRYPRGHILAGCLVSLIITTILSAALGYAAPNLMLHTLLNLTMFMPKNRPLTTFSYCGSESEINCYIHTSKKIPRQWTHHITTLLFFVFGIWSLWEGINEDGDDDELAEAEAKINQDSKGKSKNKGGSKDTDDQKKTKRPFLTQFFSPFFIKAFSITFFGEWGDRSQIATIGLAANENPFGVVLGGILGQALCTVLAVVGGKGLASYISEKIVTLASGALFIAFGVHSFISSADD